MAAKTEENILMKELSVKVDEKMLKDGIILCFERPMKDWNTQMKHSFDKND